MRAPSPNTQRPASNGLATRVPLAPASGRAEDELRRELESIRLMLGQVLRPSSTKVTPISGESATLGWARERLNARWVSAGVTSELLAALERELGGACEDRGRVERTLVRLVEARLPTASPRPRNAADSGRARRVAVIGPTGVGKTTTLAKLAAIAHLRGRRRVAMVTCDTYRIAAVEQLRVYADIIGVQLEVVQTPDQMVEAMEATAGFDTVFVDTAGRSQRDDHRLRELEALLEACDPHETHLLASAASSEAVISGVSERFVEAAGRAGVCCDRVILTKLDELPGPGAVLDAARAVGLPLSFVTTGQEVPDDIEPADAGRLAARVLGFEPRPASEAPPEGTRRDPAGGDADARALSAFVTARSGGRSGRPLDAEHAGVSS